MPDDGLRWWLMPATIGVAFAFGLFRGLILFYIYASLKYGLPIL